MNSPRIRNCRSRKGDMKKVNLDRGHTWDNARGPMPFFRQPVNWTETVYERPPYNTTEKDLHNLTWNFQNAAGAGRTLGPRSARVDARTPGLGNKDATLPRAGNRQRRVSTQLSRRPTPDSGDEVNTPSRSPARVVVVGGAIAELTATFRLKRANWDVTFLAYTSAESR
jgi:hypothetical protein